jgi:hypothetical protein
MIKTESRTIYKFTHLWQEMVRIKITFRTEIILPHKVTSPAIDWFFSDGNGTVRNSRWNQFDMAPCQTVGSDSVGPFSNEASSSIQIYVLSKSYMTAELFCPEFSKSSSQISTATERMTPFDEQTNHHDTMAWY